MTGNVEISDERVSSRGGHLGPMLSVRVGSTACGVHPPEAMIDQLLSVPYAPGQGTMSGADCWGIVELWYRHVLGIEVVDRASFPAGNDGLQAGFDAAQVWHPIVAAKDHCLVILRFRHLNAGHVGIYWQGSVLHSSHGHGCVYQPVSHRLIRPRITQFLEHR